MDSPWEPLLQHRVSSTGKVQQEHASTFTIAYVALKDPAEDHGEVKLPLCTSALKGQSIKLITSIVQEHGLRNYPQADRS